MRIAADAIRFMTCETLHLVVMEAKCEVVDVLVDSLGSGAPIQQPVDLEARGGARPAGGRAGGRDGGRLEVRG